ncbi:N-acetyltransferase family protein [Methyloraptor flagellatus]|jgi:GNAT superfamily N-acetyltransferase|uniref:GNAT family N-acetyltransferase n=1 Tax=Methyloraptor flagellatus TaxID=3162530 RepID=A0AAU7XD72_9HYPH
MSSVAPVDLHIAPATADDLPTIAEIHVRSWQAAYRELLPAAYLAGLDIADRLARWRMVVDRHGPDDALMIATTAVGPVGFVSAGRGRQAPRTDQGEIHAIYLVENAWGLGVGRALFEVCARHFRDRGFALAHLWVLADNARAIRAYRAWGGTLVTDDAIETTIAGRTLREFAVEFDLVDPDPTAS